MSWIKAILLLLTFSRELGHVLADVEKKDHFWVAYDHDADEDSHSSQHQQPPSCILADMQASVAIFGKNPLPSGSYDLFPNETTATNYTCGNIGEPQQKLILNWQPDSEIVFFFRQENGYNFMYHVVLRMLIGWPDEDETYFEIFAESAMNQEMMRAPVLFAFVCHEAFNISMEAKVAKITQGHREEGGGRNHKTEREESQVNATLVFKDVRLELFREKRYYNDFTHLKFDCVNGWPYEALTHTVTIVSFVLLTILVFTISMFLVRDKTPFKSAS